MITGETMLKRDNQQRDILGTILQEPHKQKDLHGIDELTEMIERFSKPLLSEKTKELTAEKMLEFKRLQSNLTRKKIIKKKTTHYLTNEVFRELDDANNFLRGLLPPGSKLLTTKSKIVNYAVKMLLDDFESKGDQSKLVKKLFKDKPE